MRLLSRRNSETAGEGNFAFVYSGILRAKGKRPAMDIACKVVRKSMWREWGSR